jgi:hypothetical protein
MFLFWNNKDVNLIHSWRLVMTETTSVNKILLLVLKMVHAWSDRSA